MEKSIEAFKHELASVRTGRANPTMLDRVKVNYWGEMTPLNQTAGISVVEGRQLVIKPYDKNILKDIEHAIYEANLGLTPQNDGEIIRINVPALTEETIGISFIVLPLAYLGRLRGRPAPDIIRSAPASMEALTKSS